MSKLNIFTLQCLECTGGRQLFYEDLPSLREKLLAQGYFIQLKTLEETLVDMRKLGRAINLLGVVGICPKCRKAQYWADAMGLGFEDCFGEMN